MIVQCATFSKSLNPRNINKSVSDIRIRFPFQSRFWISVSGCKLTILPDIQLANRIVIISASYVSPVMHPEQCCHSVMKKNPRIHVEKNPENNKKNRHKTRLKKVKTELEMHATGTCT